MSKNDQRNKSEINLGQETYHRGYTDGVAGNPKTIKKTHRHAHRYHIGYRHGQDQLKRQTTAPLTVVSENVAHVHHKLTAEDAYRALGKPEGFWSRVLRWIKG